MQITRKSMLSGKERTLEINVTEEQLSLWQAGELIQNAMPHLTAGEREFIKTGITDEEWDEEFGDDEEPLDDEDGCYDRDAHPDD
jgi:hypothetical protein